MKDKTKMVIIPMVIIVIIIVIIMISILILKGSQKQEEKTAVTIANDEVKSIREEIVLNRYEYDNVKSSIEVYLNYLNMKNYIMEGEKVMTDGQINGIIYSMLTPEYIADNNININNLRNYINFYDEKLVFIPVNVECIKRDNVSTYVTEGIIENLNYEVKETKRFIVNIDTAKMIFSLEPSEKEYSDLINIEQTTSQVNSEDSYNRIYSKQVNEENVSTDYFDKFKKLCISAPNVAYQYLDEEYRNARFGDVEGFKKYVSNNIDELKADLIDKYLVNVSGDYTEYICMNKNQNTYVFKEKTPTEYTVKLDEYTITSDKFKTQYEAANSENKVIMNVDKWIDMLNNRDYTAAYKVLDETFRKNNFGSEDKFEQYMRENLPLHYKVQYTGFSDENNTFVSKITLVDKTGKSNENIEKNIIMQLKEGTDFVMSFDA